MIGNSHIRQKLDYQYIKHRYVSYLITTHTQKSESRQKLNTDNSSIRRIGALQNVNTAIFTVDGKQEHAKNRKKKATTKKPIISNDEKHGYGKSNMENSLNFIRKLVYGQKTERIF